MFTKLKFYCVYIYIYPLHKVYKMRHPRPERPASLRVYECHVGISSWEGKVSERRSA